MTNPDPIVEATRNAIVEMFERLGRRKSARLVREMNLSDAAFDHAMIHFAAMTDAKPVTYADHIAVLNCPWLHFPEQVEEPAVIIAGEGFRECRDPHAHPPPEQRIHSPPNSPRHWSASG